MFGYPHIVLLEGNLLPLQFSTDEFNPVKADLRHRFVTQGEWNVLTSQVSQLPPTASLYSGIYHPGDH